MPDSPVSEDTELTLGAHLIAEVQIYVTRLLATTSLEPKAALRTRLLAWEREAIEQIRAEHHVDESDLTAR